MKKNKKIFFTLLLSTLIGIFCITIYVYTIFFANRQKHILFYKNFATTVEDISSMFDKNLDLYATRLQKTAKELDINNFIRKIFIEGVDEEHKNKIINVILNINPRHENTTLYLSDGKIVFSTEKDKTSLEEQGLLSELNKKYEEPYYKYQKDKKNIKIIIPLFTDHMVKTAYLETYIPKYIFSFSAIPNYTLLDEAILYGSENTNYLDKNAIANIGLLFKEGSGYKNLEKLPYRLYISKRESKAQVKIGALVADIPKVKNSLEYVILGIFILSLIFLIILIVLVVSSKEKYSDKAEQKHDSEIIPEKEFDTNDFEDSHAIERKYKEAGIELRNKRNDIYMADGAELDEMISKENEYFSSDKAFNVSDDDFLNILNKEEKDDEKITFDTDIVESMIENMNASIDSTEDYEINEVPVIPDDYYKNEGLGKNDLIWNGFLLDIITFNFKDKSLNEMIDKVKEELNISILKCAYLKYNEKELSYSVENALDIDDKTEKILKIDTREPLFTKLLSKGKPLYIDDPFASEVIADKFSENQYDDIKRMVFIPLKNENDIEAFLLVMKINEFNT